MGFQLKIRSALILLASTALVSQAREDVFRILAAGFGNDFVTFDFNSTLGEATFVHHQNVALEGAEGVAWMDFQEASGDLFMVHDSLGHFEGQPESGVLTRWTRADNGLDWNLREYKPSGGAVPVDVTADAEDHLLFVCNYGSSSFIVYSLLEEEEGEGLAVGEVTYQEVFPVGSGAATSQEHGHVHTTYLLPDNKVVVLDQGADLLYHFKKTEDGSNVTKIQEPNFSTAASPGTGPRHMVLDRSKALVYVVGELGRSVEVFSADFLKDSSDAGWLTSLAVVKYELVVDLPGEVERGAEIALHPNGRWLYLSHRGSGSLAVFDVVDSEDGYLLQKQAVLPAGSTPRHFLLTPDGTYMLVALKVESDIEIFAIDQEDGTIASRGTVDFDAPKEVVVMSFI